MVIVLDKNFIPIFKLQSCFTLATEKLKRLKLSACKKFIALGSHGTSNKIEIIKLDLENPSKPILKKNFLINVNL